MLTQWYNIAKRIRTQTNVVFMITKYYQLKPESTFIFMLANHSVILITGGCGAIGSVVLNTFIRKYPDTRFINIDALTYCGKPEHVHVPYHQNNYKLYHHDITDTSTNTLADILMNEQPTAVIHLAAETHVDESFEYALKFTKTNTYGTHVLLEALRKYGECKTIIHMSTDEVYGSIDQGSFRESSLFAPSNPYSASKAGAEMICHSYQASFQLPIIITRCNNAISPFQHPEKLVPKCIECFSSNPIVTQRQITKMSIHGNGEARRTFIDARDIASALETILAKGSPKDIYNIGTPSSTHEFTVMEIVHYIHRRLLPYTHFQDYIEHVTDRAFQDMRYSIDTTSLQNLGWAPVYSVWDAIDNVIEHKNQPF